MLSREELDAIEGRVKAYPVQAANDIRRLLSAARKLERVRAWAHYPEWADDPQKCGCHKALCAILDGGG